MGPHDLVRRVEAELGVEEVFWGVAVKPGKPLPSASASRPWSSGSRETPCRRSSARSCSLRRAGRAAGSPIPGRPSSAGRAARPLRRNAERDEFVRARRALDRRRRAARADVRTGVAHDRARGRGATRSCTSRAARARSREESPSATSPSRSDGAPCDRRRASPAGGGLAPTGVRGVTAEGERAELGRGCRPGEREQHRSEGDVPDRREPEHVQERVERAEPDLVARRRSRDRRDEPGEEECGPRPETAAPAGARARRRGTGGRRRAHTASAER